MSFILDALRRADQERQQDSNGLDIHSPPQAAPYVEPAGNRTGLWIALGIAAIVLTVFLSVTLSTRLSLNTQSVSAPPTPSESAPISKPVITEQAIEPMQPQALPVEPPSKSVTMPAENALQAEVVALYQRTNEPAGGVSASVRNLYVQPDPPAARQPAQARTTQSPTPAEPAQPAERPALSARAEEILAARVPQVHELPRTLQQSIPSIHYNDHQYRDSAASTVVLNGRELRAGAQLSQDLQVDDILDDGVVMIFKGQKFKLRAHNSWINM
ncbi:general secretion pathway protein GspB [Marinimicrobium sp. ABcell2]|uniref:general secretion pathway protein GspB n=1 Tax=Marinimicrobium sp. ABcell2 TaxID=3069751 RepID=UPI0027B565D6|nr:general secretion pathway protein GspB [Marinimicrobium sp. ABcell2]MDQ2075180.1 general secretion pathway protein GspB [Marinimicrobium sp. ABcell2]